MRHLLESRKPKIGRKKQTIDAYYSSRIGFPHKMLDFETRVEDDDFAWLKINLDMTGQMKYMN